MMHAKFSNGPDHLPSETTILVVDDDVALCEMMIEYLGSSGFNVRSAYNGRDGLACALKNDFSLIILDGMLPFLDGLEALRQLRKHSNVPVIMLTARTRESDRITGLDTGADDYLPKPFSPGELLARVRAVLRRFNNAICVRPDLLKTGPLELDQVKRIVKRSGQIIALTDTEFSILELLMRSAGRIVTRDEISSALYQRATSPFERSLDVHLSNLRKKVEQNGPPLIQTVRGAGYIMLEEVG